jgi:hypothetical protein
MLHFLGLALRYKGAEATHKIQENKLVVESLSAQADAVKQALETRVRAQTINPWVRFEEPSKVQRSLQIGFL